MHFATTLSVAGLLAGQALALPSLLDKRANNTATGEIHLKLYNGTAVGCIDSEFHWITDYDNCDTFTIIDYPLFPHAFGLRNEAGWGCSNVGKFYGCAQNWTTGDWFLEHRQKTLPVTGDTITGEAYGIGYPDSCSASPLLPRLHDNIAQQIGVTMYWHSKPKNGPAPTPTPTKAPMWDDELCTSTSTLTPSHTHTPSSTGLPFGGETVGYFKVLHQNEKVGWLTEEGKLSAQGSKRGVFYPTYESKANFTTAMRSKGMNWWCTANDGPDAAFACSKEIESVQNFYVSGYNAGYGPKPSDMLWHTSKIPEGDETVSVSQKSGDFEVEVVWYELD